MRSLLLVVPLLFLTACGGKCAGPARYPPSLFLDVAPWFAAHPNDTVTACLDGRCENVVAADAHGPVQLVVPTGKDPSMAMTVTVTDGSGLHARRDFTLNHRTEDSACGRFEWWDAKATLTGGGTLQPG
jgi:predicted small lipoprotein YifL